MLSASEFAIGTVSEATPLSLLIPYTKYGATFLVGMKDGAATAVFLSGEHQFRHFQTGGNDNWSGVIIPDVSLTVDVKSAFDPRERDTAVGALIRSGDKLSITSLSEDSRRSRIRIMLNDGLPSAKEEDFAVGFSRWHVTVGQDDGRRVLLKIDIDTDQLT